MTTAVAQYKCRRCGDVFDGPESSVEVMQRCMQNLLTFGRDMGAGIPLAKTEMHQCAHPYPVRDPGWGVGDLIGFKEVES